MTSHEAELESDIAAPFGYLRADSVPEFRMGQLLLAVAADPTPGRSLDLERLAVVEFLAANPFLVVDPEGESALQLRLAGFGIHSLSYAAPGQRYATRRHRLLRDLGQLVALGLISVEVSDGRRVLVTTALGRSQVEHLTSTYADAFRASLAVVLPIVRRLTDAALRRQLEIWLRADPALFDLIDLDPSAPPTLDQFLLTPGGIS